MQEFSQRRITLEDFKPHAYQKRGINWILEHSHCGLFLPMGAGKTVTTLAAIDLLMHDAFEVEKVLIIGPKRVIENSWPDEIQKWQQAKDFKWSVISGSVSQREAAISRDADLYLIGKENVPWLVDYVGRDWKWDLVVIDELSTFKNPQAKRFKALRTVIPRVKRFIGLTGTPAPKGIPDLWAQVYLMDQGKRLGKTLSQFRQRYLKPEKMSGHIVYSWGVKPDAKKEIQEKISDICMSIGIEEYASLPDVQYLNEPVDLKDDLIRYRAFRDEMVLEVGEDETILAANAGVLCGKLLQFTSGQVYDDHLQAKTIHSHKLEALLDLMESANSEPVLIFYWFQHEKERILEALKKKGYKGTPLDNSNALKAWNNKNLDFLLLQPSSAGHGLNLQAGGHIAIWYSLPNWNLELYQQANARIYRQGQKEKVTIYHLLAKGTIDELMLKALKRKEVTQKDLLEALKA